MWTAPANTPATATVSGMGFAPQGLEQALLDASLARESELDALARADADAAARLMAENEVRDTRIALNEAFGRLRRRRPEEDIAGMAELVADDYRMLFGTTDAVSASSYLQSQLPDPRTVAGLKDFLSSGWTAP